MIYVRDNFFEEQTFKSLQEYCKQEFVIQKAGEKEFLVLPTPEDLIPLLQMDGHEMVLTFVRQAHREFDTTLRVHGDGIIQGKKTSIASVLYINDENGVTPNGTRFFKHITHNYKLPHDVSNEEFDRLIKEDANNPDCWKEVDRINARPNRMLVYESSLFHAKFPKKILRGKRTVLVSFYSKLEV